MMNWQTLESLTIVAMLILAIGLHQLIRRFGKNYAAEIFRSTPSIGTSFLILADVAYYLIFAAYILSNVHFERVYRTLSDGSRIDIWAERVNASQLQDSVSSIAGICLIIGILHGLNVFVLPFIGSILALRAKLMESRRE
ncbi:MAG: hypothetical protein IH984_10770 [Planctomycetes bacterium]|nr:hypothetical protein [Planctomycetota bacterium]